MLMCNHKIRMNLMRCLRNSTTRREIGQLFWYGLREIRGTKNE